LQSLEGAGDFVLVIGAATVVVGGKLVAVVVPVGAEVVVAGLKEVVGLDEPPLTLMSAQPENQNPPY
jgi:hypothetical protein